MSETRDRPYVRMITVMDVDRGKIETILSNIARDNVIHYIDSRNDVTRYLVRIKQEELLVIKLTIPCVMVDKMKKTKTKYYGWTTDFERL
jgi:hypothetical protein